MGKEREEIESITTQGSSHMWVIVVCGCDMEPWSAVGGDPCMHQELEFYNPGSPHKCLRTSTRSSGHGQCDFWKILEVWWH